MSSSHKESDIIDVEFVSDSRGHSHFHQANYQPPFQKNLDGFQKKKFKISPFKVIFLILLSPFILAFLLLAALLFCVFLIFFMPKILRFVRAKKAAFQSQFGNLSHFIKRP